MYNHDHDNHDLIIMNEEDKRAFIAMKNVTTGLRAFVIIHDDQPLSFSQDLTLASDP